jgi:hypothetical protein
MRHQFFAGIVKGVQSESSKTGIYSTSGGRNPMVLSSFESMEIQLV